MKIGYFQFEPRFGDSSANLDCILRGLDGADADLMVLPELALTGYYFESRSQAMALAETPEESSAVRELVALCARKSMMLAIGFAERAGDRVYNSALLLGEDGILHTYRKLHLFNTEKECFDPGDRPLDVVDAGGARLGLMICFDWRFPEVARSYAVQGAQILCHPANLVIPEHCQRVMKVRCLENHIFAVTANRYGADRTGRGDIAFTGLSQVVDPRGGVLHRGPAGEDELFIAEIDPAEADDKTVTPRNDCMADRRPECYRL